jgi:integrase
MVGSMKALVAGRRLELRKPRQHPILKAVLRPRSYVDLERGIFYRKPIGKRATKKRQTPAPIPSRLLSHMRRWKARRLIASYFVEFNGKPVASVKKGFKSAARLAGLPGKVTPHTLRHNCPDLANAARRPDLGGGRVPWHVARGSP